VTTYQFAARSVSADSGTCLSNSNRPSRSLSHRHYHHRHTYIKPSSSRNTNTNKNTQTNTYNHVRDDRWFFLQLPLHPGDDHPQSFHLPTSTTSTLSTITIFNAIFPFGVSFSPSFIPHDEPFYLARFWFSWKREEYAPEVSVEVVIEQCDPEGSFLWPRFGFR
jgi:hypothetical protein